MISKRLLLVVPVILAMALSGCGKLVPGQDNVAQKGSLSVVIKIPADAGMSAQSFLDEIDLDRVEVTLSKDGTPITKTAVINDNDSSAVIEFPDITVGEWTVSAVVKDTGDYDIYSGTGSGVVTAGTSSTVVVGMNVVSATVTITVQQVADADSGTVELVLADESDIAARLRMLMKNLYV